jgi:hypothetical protein
MTRASIAHPGDREHKPDNPSPALIARLSMTLVALTQYLDLGHHFFERKGAASCQQAQQPRLELTVMKIRVFSTA